jgi:hypothetical protein
MSLSLRPSIVTHPFQLNSLSFVFIFCAQDAIRFALISFFFHFCRREYTQGPREAQDGTICLNIPRLAAWLENGRPTVTRFCAGSMSVDLQRWWEEQGYTTLNGKTDKSMNADEVLHAQIYRAIGRSEIGNENSNLGTIVLVTGDGNDNNGLSNFPECIALGIRLGWHVEVCCWGHSLSSNHRKLERSHPLQVTIRDLLDAPPEAKLRYNRPSFCKVSGCALPVRSCCVTGICHREMCANCHCIPSPADGGM